MRGALESHRPVDRLHQVVMGTRNLADGDGEASADLTVPSPSSAVDMLEARWDNS
jgi:hypothetical protein